MVRPRLISNGFGATLAAAADTDDIHDAAAASYQGSGCGGEGWKTVMIVATTMGGRVAGAWWSWECQVGILENCCRWAAGMTPRLSVIPEYFNRRHKHRWVVQGI